MFVVTGILCLGNTLGIFMLGMLEVLILSIDNCEDKSYGNLHNCFPKFTEFPRCFSKRYPVLSFLIVQPVFSV